MQSTEIVSVQSSSMQYPALSWNLCGVIVSCQMSWTVRHDVLTYMILCSGNKGASKQSQTMQISYCQVRSDSYTAPWMHQIMLAWTGGLLSSTYHVFAVKHMDHPLLLIKSSRKTSALDRHNGLDILWLDCTLSPEKPITFT